MDEPAADTAPRALPPAVALLVVALTAAFVAQALMFAGAQDLWTDESTQLAGIRLPVGRMLAWLAGDRPPLGVPPDRMPPLSYLADMACARTVCTSIHALRVFHLLIAAMGLALLLDGLGRRYGWLGLTVAGLFLALSSNLVTQAPELRAYPLFFACACVQVRLFYALFDRPGLSPRALGGFALVAVVTIYVHFFGLVSSCALFVGLLAGKVRSLREGAVLGAAWGAVLIAALGLLPFVVGAQLQSPNPVPPADLGDVGRFLLRMTGYSALLIRPWMAWTFFGGLVAVLLVLAWRAAPQSRADVGGVWPPERALLAALLAGLGVTIVAAFVFQGFEPLKASYSIWMLPVLAALLGAACVGAGGGVRAAALAGAAVMLVGTAGGQWMVMRHMRWFTHGTTREIAAQFTVPPERVAIVYEGDYWPTADFAFNYLYGRRLRQWRLDEAGVPHRLPFVFREALPPGGPAEAQPPVEQVVFASIHPETYRELQELDAGVIPADQLQPLDPSPGWLGAGWSAGNEIRIPGNYWLRMMSFHRSAGR